MRPSSRRPVNKRKSAKQFQRNVTRTKELNIRPIPMRGGFRL